MNGSFNGCRHLTSLWCRLKVWGELSSTRPGSWYKEVVDPSRGLLYKLFKSRILKDVSNTACLSPDSVPLMDLTHHRTTYTSHSLRLFISKICYASFPSSTVILHCLLPLSLAFCFQKGTDVVRVIQRQIFLLFPFRAHIYTSFIVLRNLTMVKRLWRQLSGRSQFKLPIVKTKPI